MNLSPMKSARGVRIYVVSLPGSQARRESIASQLGALRLSFEFVDAVFGRELPAEALERYRANQRRHAGWKRDLSPGEIGCALSHQSVYERVLAAGIGKAIILEDDVVLSEDFVRFHALLMDGDPFPRNCVVLLGGGEGVTQFRYVITAVRGAVAIGQSAIRRCVGSDRYLWGTCCYAVDLETARRLRELNHDVKASADNWGYFKRCGAYREIYLAQPWIVRHPEQGVDQSLIQAEREASEREAGGKAGALRWIRSSLRRMQRAFVYAITYPRRFF
jgi:GR25 family glycosyltransferase involved in LPS biosynthesis